MFRPLPHLFAELYRECRVCGVQCVVCAGDPHENICFTQRHFTHGSLGLQTGNSSIRAHTIAGIESPGAERGGGPGNNKSY